MLVPETRPCLISPSHRVIKVSNISFHCVITTYEPVTPGKGKLTRGYSTYIEYATSDEPRVLATPYIRIGNSLNKHFTEDMDDSLDTCTNESSHDAHHPHLHPRALHSRTRTLSRRRDLGS
jgi:hypothetical protein